FDLVFRGIVVASRKAHLSGEQDRLSGGEDRRIRFDLRVAKPDGDAPGEIFEIEERDLSIFEDALAVALDAAHQFDDCPVVLRRALARRDRLESRERRSAAKIPLERMSRDVEAERLPFARE